MPITGYSPTRACAMGIRLAKRAYTSVFRAVLRAMKQTRLLRPLHTTCTSLRGLNPDNGGAEIISDALSGGGVSAGSITYPSSILVDDTISRLTANAIRHCLGEE